MNTGPYLKKKRFWNICHNHTISKSRDSHFECPVWAFQLWNTARLIQWRHMASVIRVILKFLMLDKSFCSFMYGFIIRFLCFMHSCRNRLANVKCCVFLCYWIYIWKPTTWYLIYCHNASFYGWYKISKRQLVSWQLVLWSMITVLAQLFIRHWIDQSSSQSRPMASVILIDEIRENGIIDLSAKAMAYIIARGHGYQTLNTCNTVQ